MNKSILELMSNVTGLDLIFTLALILVIAAVAINQRQKITKYLNKWRKTKNDDESFRALVYELRKSLEELSEKQSQQSESINKLTKTVLKIQEINSETSRAGIKEKIERIFRECHPSMTCTDMQLETLKDLIVEYEKHGGNNSFVHSTVQPEMYEWKVIHEIKK